jgi:hypothetical protein
MSIDDTIEDRLLYEDGHLYWKNCTKPSLNGKKAGCVDSAGYTVVKISSKVYKAHRVIWFLCNGYWPEGWIDHIDRNKSNNKLENLREVTFSQSNANRDKSTKLKVSKYKGVSKNRHYTWKATIQDKFLGCFPTEELAAEAYNKSAKEIFGEYAKLNDLEIK